MITKTRATAMAAALLTALLLTDCGTADELTGVASVGSPALAIRNETDRSIWFVQLRACGTQSWGEDLLGAAVVAAGQSIERPVTRGCHDVRVRSDPRSAREVTWSALEFTAGAATALNLADWSRNQ